MKKKKLLAALMAGLLLGGTALPAAQAESAEEQAAIEEAEPVEGAPLESLAVNPSLRSLGIYKIVNRYKAADGDVPILSQSWAEIMLLDAKVVTGQRSMMRVDSYPALAGALRAFNDEEYQDALRARESMVAEARMEARARGEAGNAFHGYYARKDFIPRRADSAVVSLLASDVTYTGGAHGMTVLRGVNFNAADGTRISLNDVCPDGEMLVSVILERLRQDYRPETFFDSMEATVANQVIGHKIAWTLDARGITFYFNHYDIAPYASGILTTKILFDERPGLFNPQYTGGPAAYCEYLPKYIPSIISLHDNPAGIRDELQIISRDGGGLRIVLNGTAFEDTYAGVKDFVPIHVHTGAGKNYLYLDCSYLDQPDREIRIYNLDGTAPVFVRSVANTMQSSVGVRGSEQLRQWLMTDPYEFRLDDGLPVDAEGTIRSHSVEISRDGIPAFG